MGPARKSSSRRTEASAWATAVVALIGCAVFLALVAPGVLPYGRTHDFLPVPATARLVQQDPAHLYDPAAQKNAQLALAPDMPVFVPFVRPAFAALLYIPLAGLSIESAFNLWISLGAAVLIAVWVWAARRYGPEILVYCAFFLPPIYGIIHGQDAAFLLGLLLAAVLAGERGAKTLQGALLALLLIKFHLFLLLPLALLLRREWKVLKGYVPTALVLVAISAWITPVRPYLAMLTDDSAEALNPSLQMMINVQSIAINFGLNFAIVKLALGAAVAAAVVLIPRDAPFERWFPSTVIGGVLLSPHAYQYDAAFFLIPILSILADKQAAPLRRAIAATAAIPLPYFMTLLPKPYSAGTAIVCLLLFLSIAWPEWFEGRVTKTAALERA